MSISSTLPYTSDVFKTLVPFIDPVELDLAGAPAAVLTYTFSYAINLKFIGIRITTTFNSTGDSVLSVKNSSGTEVATFNIPTGSAAGTVIMSATPLDVLFDDGIAVLHLKTAATTAGKGHPFLILTEGYVS
jgi:hypothetical protein